MCFTNVNEAGIRYRYFMYSTNKCTDFNKNITLHKKKKKKKLFFPRTISDWIQLPYYSCELLGSNIQVCCLLYQILIYKTSK